MAGLYIHIPFCGQLCTYCDFHFSTSLRDKSEMIAAIKQEMSLRSKYLDGQEIKTIYFGGGTPSLLSINELTDIIFHIKKTFNIATSLDEFTFEANPEDLNYDYLKGLINLGINRLSIGVQSFDDTTLRLMNRRHNANRAIDAVSDAKKAGFDNISVDLIFGVPERSIDVLKSDIEILLSLDVQHISAYHLTIEEKTVLGQRMKKGAFNPVAESESEKQYELTESMLLNNKYNHYEVSNYALKGYEAIHNSSYWSGKPYIGIGPSAHSYNGIARQWNVAINRDYMDKVNSRDVYYEIEVLTLDDRYNEYIMTSLRTSKGICLLLIEERWGVQRVEYVIRQAEQFIRTGVLIKDDKENRIYIDTSRFLLSDTVIAELFI